METHFLNPSGEVISFPSEYNEKGEDLTLKKVLERHSDLTPVYIMSNKDSINSENYKEFPVKYHEVARALKLGLKPVEQREAEKSAQEAHEKVQRGDINYKPGKLETGETSFAQGITFNSVPTIAGTVEGVKRLAKGGSFDTGFKEGREASQSVITAGEKENPITATVAKTLGATFPLATTPSGIIPAATSGALYGGISEAQQSANKGKTIEEVGKEGLKGSALGGAIGGGTALIPSALGVVGSAIKGGGELIKKRIPEATREAFKRAFEGDNLADPEIRNQARTIAADYTNVFKNTIDDLRRSFGKQKGELLNKSPKLENKLLINSIENADSKLNDLIKEKGYHLQVQKAKEPIIRESQNHINSLKEQLEHHQNVMDNIETQLNKIQETPLELDNPFAKEQIKNLSKMYKDSQREYNRLDRLIDKSTDDLHSQLKNIEENPAHKSTEVKDLFEAKKLLNHAKYELETRPNSTHAIDSVKQTLGNKIFNEGFLKKNYYGKEIIDQVREDAQKALEGHIPELGGTNRAYKEIIEAQDPQDAYEAILLTPPEIESIGSDVPSATALLKLKNANELNKSIQENPFSPQSTKDTFNTLLQDLNEITERANIAKKIQSGKGILGAKLGNYLNPEKNALTKGIQQLNKSASKGINGVSEVYFNKLDPKIQKLIETSPKFAKKYIKKFPEAAAIVEGETYLENKNE